MYIPRLVYPFSCLGHLSLFLHFGWWEQYCIEHCLQVSASLLSVILDLDIGMEVLVCNLGVSSKENSWVLTLGEQWAQEPWEMFEGEKQKLHKLEGRSYPHLSPAPHPSFFVPRRKMLQLRKKRKTSKKLKTHTHTWLRRARHRSPRG